RARAVPWTRNASCASLRVSNVGRPTRFRSGPKGGTLVYGGPPRDATARRRVLTKDPSRAPSRRRLTSDFVTWSNMLGGAAANDGGGSLGARGRVIDRLKRTGTVVTGARSTRPSQSRGRPSPQASRPCRA